MLMTFYYTAKDMLHDWIRTLINVINLAVVIVSYLLLSALAGTLNTFMNQPRLYPNLIVIENEVIDPGDSRVSEQSLEIVRAMPRQLVKKVSPFIFRHMRIGDRVIQVRAAPQSDWVSVFNLSLLEGHWPDSTRQVVIGEGAADLNHWQVGEEINIFDADFTITGIFRSPGTKYASVWLPLEEAQRLFGMAQAYNALYVQVTPGADAENVRQQLLTDSQLTGKYTVFYEDTFARRNSEGASNIRNLLVMVSFTSLLAVVLGTFNATNLSLAERGRELGILRAIGFSTQGLCGLLVLRSLLQALFAFILGLLVVLFYTLGPLQSGNIVILGAPFSMSLTPGIVFTGLGLVFVFALLGAWLPTRRLMEVNVASAISGQ
jgi:ABC-type antimicrobial peptide transport system permease subunit